MKPKKSPLLIYREKIAEVHTPEEIKAAFDDTVGKSDQLQKFVIALRMRERDHLFDRFFTAGSHQILKISHKKSVL